MLRNYRCHKVILVQPEERKRCKTDRRDAAALCELLWVNRDRFLTGQPVRGLRQVDIPNSTDRQDRKLTTLRKEACDRQLARYVEFLKEALGKALGQAIEELITIVTPAAFYRWVRDEKKAANYLGFVHLQYGLTALRTAGVLG